MNTDTNLAVDKAKRKTLQQIEHEVKRLTAAAEKAHVSSEDQHGHVKPDHCENMDRLTARILSSDPLSVAILLSLLACPNRDNHWLEDEETYGTVN